MSESQVGRNVPEVTLFLEIDPSLDRVLDAGGPLNEAVRQEISRGLAEILDHLGIPGTPTVQLSDPKEKPMRADQFMRVYVNGQLCRYPDELLQRVHSYVNGILLDPTAQPGSILAWLSELSNNEPEMGDLAQRRLIDFLSITCLEIIKRQPAVLLGLTQTEAYTASLSDLPNTLHTQQGTWPPDPTWLLPILREVLDLKISVADKQTVADVLASGRQRSREDVIEDLIVALHPEVVEIQISQEYLREITTVDPENALGVFTFLRDGMFEELGLTYPSFRFVLNERLGPSSFAFKINHLTTLPWTGLQRDQCLVNETHSRLELLDIQGIAASIPATGFEGSIIDCSYQSLVEAAGLTTWNQAQYLVLCFAVNLRENGPCFLHRQLVLDQLEQLSYIFPALLQTFRSKMTFEQTTRVLRALISEGISIRDLRRILERLLDYDYASSDASRHLVLADPLSTFGYLAPDQHNGLSHLVSFVRAGLRQQISHKYARGTNTLVAYLLDPALEKLLSEHQYLGLDEERIANPDEGERDKVLEAIRTEVALLPSSVTVPAILTTNEEARLSLREIIAPEFPRTPVLSYQEIPPGTNVQPVARITLNA